MLSTARALLFIATFVATNPAFALTVTNLDHVPHRVQLASRGTNDVREIAPNATEYFIGTPGGELSLLSAKPAKRSQSTVQSDGLLSGVIGAARNTNIPVDNDYGYVIWPGGNLQLQKNRVSQGRY